MSKGFFAANKATCYEYSEKAKKDMIQKNIPFVTHEAHIDTLEKEKENLAETAKEYEGLYPSCLEEGKDKQEVIMTLNRNLASRNSTLRVKQLELENLEEYNHELLGSVSRLTEDLEQMKAEKKARKLLHIT